MAQRLEGRIRSVIYKNDDTGYAVLRLETPDGALATAVGCLPFAAPGEELEASGEWVNHPQHGSQFSVGEVSRRLPSSLGAIKEYLGSGVIRGIGVATAGLLVERFGADTLKVLEETPSKLAEVRGITPKRARQIGDAYSRQTGLRRLMELLAGYEISPAAALKLVQRYGPQASGAVLDNPYILADEFFGVDFFKADQMALGLGMEPDDTRRCKAALMFELRYNLDLGHVYLPRDKLLGASVEMSGIDTPALTRALDALSEDGAVVACEDGCCYLDFVYAAETSLAEFIIDRHLRRKPPPKGLLELIKSIEDEMRITYAPAQRQAVALSAQSGLLLLTGGPGTGKTTTVRAMLEVFDRMRMKAALAAPTGRAAKRMGELTGREASTIHRLLEFGYDPETGAMGFQRDEDNPLPADVVIIDEASMVDILLMSSLVRALKPDTVLVLVGDPDQLPPVGPGKTLEDLLSCGLVDTVRLTEIFRQAQESRIVMGAHQVNRGEAPLLRNNGGDFFFMRRKNPEDAVRTILELCAERLPKGLGLNPSQIQVLSPTRKGRCGTASLNRLLQEALNPPEIHKLEKRYGDTVFREGDRVMHIRNNYELAWRYTDGSGTGLGVFNGEVGVISSVDLKAEILTVLYDDREADYAFDSLNELELAYAMTVHKSQGSEYPAVVLSVSPGPAQLMTRSVLYTAMTRAKDWLVMVGDEEVVAHMIDNNRRRKRYGRLAERIAERCDG